MTTELRAAIGQDLAAEMLREKIHNILLETGFNTRCNCGAEIDYSYYIGRKGQHYKEPHKNKPCDGRYYGPNCKASKKSHDECPLPKNVELQLAHTLAKFTWPVCPCEYDGRGGCTCGG